MVVISSGCTVLTNKLPNQVSVNTTDAPVSDVEDSPTGQLAAMHDSSKMDVAWVFQYYRLITTIPTKVLNDEYAKTSKDFSGENTVWSKWRLAMLLSLPSASFYDPERSSTLFKELADSSSGQDSVINDAAFLMYSWVKTLHQANTKTTDLEAHLSELRSANKTLQEQLNALKAIEENLYQRNKVEVQPKP